MRITNRKLRAAKFSGLALILSLVAVGSPLAAANNSLLQDSLCQVVYPLDQDPATGAYRYMFLGNGFFINEDGYVLTANHLLSWFRDGLDASVVVGPVDGPRRVLDATIIAADSEHDVAILRVNPNP